MLYRQVSSAPGETPDTFFSYLKEWVDLPIPLFGKFCFPCGNIILRLLHAREKIKDKLFKTEHVRSKGFGAELRN
jgi:hypothetical protein